MHRIFAYTNRTRPGLHVWRKGTNVRLYLHPVRPPDGSGWMEFEFLLNPAISNPVRFMLFSFDDQGSPSDFESNAFQRELPPLPANGFPPEAWCASETHRVVFTDPRQRAETQVRVHLISLSRFRPGEMYLWDPVKDSARRISQSGTDALGPFFDVTLQGHEKAFFNFKFIRQENGEFKIFEDDQANRWWVADDGTELWTHSGTPAHTPAIPETRTLTVHYRQEFGTPALMHLWAKNGDFITDVAGTSDGDFWTTFSTNVFTQLPYGVLFRNPGFQPEWEHEEAKRVDVTIKSDTEFWTLEGDDTLFDAKPVADRQLDLSIASTALTSLVSPFTVDVRINRARANLRQGVKVSSAGNVTLQVYPEVTTSIQFRDGNGRSEHFRHAIQVEEGSAPLQRFVVLERPPLLPTKPPVDLVADPPFLIRRPGAYEERGELRFVVHMPHSADVKLIGEWTAWLSNPVQMRSTRDGTYWWASVKVADVLAGLADGRTDYHGVKYQFMVNEVDRFQDPAAGWVETSNTRGFSRLVNHGRFNWRNQPWNRPTADYYIIYQLHPNRFTNRFQDERPLRRVAKEISENSGYFRELGVTAIQLLPVNEVSSKNSWGYDPAYFYAIEDDYCGDDGPDDLKHLVHTCHEHGLAVILDVVFNHAGGDNILWEISRDSFFDGDTQWGALVNFDHPQCLHFFSQNLVYLANEFRIDAFRLDHTATIVHSAAWDSWSGSVRQLGSGGGWQFLHGLRSAVQTQVGQNCLLIAEHLPNEWSMTNFGGPMDSQWGDDFHDRLVDACRRQFGMSRLANAFKLTQTASDDWYKIVNYPESHDEVGNVPDRVAHVAGFGQGWRMSKVAAAATLLSRGMPLFFMGAESAEDKQFQFGKDTSLDLTGYLANDDRRRIRLWWRELGLLRGNPSIKGPSPLDVRFVDDQVLAFSRGQGGDFFIVLNFGGWSGQKFLGAMNVPPGTYRELWNSTWPAFAIRAENEGEHTNGGRDARLHGSDLLSIPDYGVVILEKV